MGHSDIHDFKNDFLVTCHCCLMKNLNAVFLKSCRATSLYRRKIVLTGNTYVHVCHPDCHEVLFHN